MRRPMLVLVLAMVAAVVPAAADDACAGTEAQTSAPALGHADTAGDVRVFAIQYKHEIRHVRTYETFRLKMRCLMLAHVVPNLPADGRPSIVVFNEDAGLATIATGTRGIGARVLAEAGPKDPQNIPGALSAFAALAPGYAPAIAHYALAEPDTSPQRLILAAATDTFVRGFMQVNSDLAREFGVYVVSSNNQAEFRTTSDPRTVAALRDPDLPMVTTVYEAVDTDEIDEAIGAGRAGIDVTNQAWMWAPADPPTTHPAQQRYAAINGAPLADDDPRRNIINVTKKTPLTQIERDVLDLSDDRDMRASNTGPFPLLPEHDQRVRLGYGISLPAFKWGGPAFGGEPFGTPLDDGVDPCGQPETWMRCLDARGMNLFLQPEANPGMWAEYHDAGWNPPAFQALSWLDSAWRAVADPTVANIRYAVTPHLVGNLVDLTFDGQSVIFERCSGASCASNPGGTFVGASSFLSCALDQTARCDDPLLEPYAGPLDEVMVMAPWVMGDGPLDVLANREMLAERSRAMQAGTGSPHENDYLETAIWADLDFD